MPEVLRFGISSLDELFGVPSETSKRGLPPGIYLPPAEDGNPVSEKFQAAGKHKGIPTTSVCIVGPTGTGKSIFALHMASKYLADCRAEEKRAKQSGKDISLPTVLYVSTDLSHNMAQRAWTNFALDRPSQRREPFFSPSSTERNQEIEILLKDCHPIGLAEQFDITETEKSNVIFLDMAGYTAGDDWGFLHKILSLLSVPKEKDPRHLVVIDAIEGFEALAGKLNAFGETSTRRSRIAQVMRLISGKCHALLIVEQGKGGTRGVTLDEEFVADTVIRLDSVSTRNYERRVLKVEKCRGQSHIRGLHHYSIRSGQGSSTGEQMNPDDPKLPAFSPPAKPSQPLNPIGGTQTSRDNKADDAVEKAESTDNRTQSYVQVFHSVHRISRRIMEDETKKPESPMSRHGSRYAAFGIKYLDNMLGGKMEFTKRASAMELTTRQSAIKFDYDTRGLPCGSTTALIGDSLTQKSTLGKAFLSRCFYSFDTRLRDIWRRLSMVSSDRNIADDLWQHITRKVSLTSAFPPDISSTSRELLNLGQIAQLIQKLESVVGKHSIVSSAAKVTHSEDLFHLLTHLATWMLDYRGGVAVMLATLNTDVDLLASDFIRWLHSDAELRAREREMPGYREALRNYIKRGTVCRRLEIHSLSSEVLVHIVRQCVRDAQKKILTPLEVSDRNLRHPSSWPVRVVIDDFSSLRNIFPELREDPLLFPSILFHLEREGVTTLIIDTQSGKPETTIVERFETELRQMVHHRLYTWRVPFYGESRVAITAIPPLSHQYAGIVRELRWETELGEGAYGEPAIVDPHFELYSGLEEAKPEPVPLQVRFYAETPAMEKYIELENAFLNEMFSHYPGAKDSNPKTIIVGSPVSDYGELRAFAYMQRDTRLDYSYVFQVDEFWLMRCPGRHKRAGAFQPQWSYLDAITASASGSPEKAEDYKPNPYADPYELFQLRNQDSLPTSGDGKLSPELRRRHFYEKYYEDFNGYETFERGHKEQFHLDRVPFAWDFGFLLCEQSAWIDNTRGLYITRRDGTRQEITVRDVWQVLVKAQHDETSSPEIEPAPRAESQLKYISWRIFAEACKKAAEEKAAMSSKRVTAFDFAQISPESFSSLLLEMWLSQIYDSLTSQVELSTAEDAALLLKARNELVSAVRRRMLFTPVDERAQRGFSLPILLEKYWLELYTTWLLLIEIIDLPSVIGDATVSTFELRSKNTDFCAVASRHWYKTATQCPDEIATRDPLVAVRLPGHFAVRGDWSLAVSGGSRSVRQAERALDLLSSRRANVTRLQMGVGLPTRVPRPSQGMLFTKLISHQRGQDHLEYNTFLKITAAEDQEFFWLWRSSIQGYAQCNRIWHRWLNRTLLWWHRKLLRYRSAWVNSFRVCDSFANGGAIPREKFAPTRQELRQHYEITKATESSEQRKKLQSTFLDEYPETHSIAQLNIRVEFLESLEGLRSELQQVSVKSGP